MKPLVSLSLVFVLAACVNDTVNPPTDSRGERKLCDDGSRYSFLNAQPIEFGKSYELSSGLVWFRTVTDRPTKVTLRLDNLPDYGLVNFSVLNYKQQPIIADNFSAVDGPIPSSATFTGEVKEAGVVFVELEHINFDLSDTRCPKYQFTLFRE